MRKLATVSTVILTAQDATGGADKMDDLTGIALFIVIFVLPIFIYSCLDLKRLNGYSENKENR